jgi:hypothetical protein
MTLKEKFKKQLDTATPTLNRPFYQAEKCESIADEFAIGFAEWFSDNTLRVDLDAYKTFGDNDETKPNTIKELLEIYKNRKV